MILEGLRYFRGGGLNTPTLPPQYATGTERAPSWSCSQAVSKPVCIAVCTVKTPGEGQRNCPKHVEFYSKNKFEKLVHLVGFIIRTYGSNYFANKACTFTESVRNNSLFIFCYLIFTSVAVSACESVWRRTAFGREWCIAWRILRSGRRQPPYPASAPILRSIAAPALSSAGDGEP